MMYVLDEHGQPQRCADLQEWAAWIGKEENRRVALTYFGDGSIEVSTVFLGLDHSHITRIGSTTAPVLWETMIFCKPDVRIEGLHNFQERYDSLENAKRGHDTACAHVRSVIDECRCRALEDAKNA